MKRQAPRNRLVGDMPIVGIRPTIDGRLNGVRESLEGTTHGDGARGRAAHRIEPAARQRPARAVRHGRPLHRRRGRGGDGGREVPPRGRRRVAHRHAVLVLRLRDDGHGPARAEGGVGVQRHRAAGRRLPGRGERRAQPEGAAGLHDLRPRRAGSGRHGDPGRRARRRSSRSCAAASPWPRCAGSRTCRSAACRWASPARSWTPTCSKTTSGCASSRWTCRRSCGASTRRSSTRPSSRRRSPGCASTARRAATSTGRRVRASARTGSGRSSSRWR